MAIRLPSQMMPHQVIIREHEGEGANGPILSATNVVRAYVEDKPRLVLDSTGQEVASSTRVWLDLDTPVSVGAQVTVWPTFPHERTAKVLAVARREHPSAPSHLQIDLA